MFTGIIEELGQVEGLVKRAEGAIITARAPLIVPELFIGESVAVNGACLTVVAVKGSLFQADVMPETLNKTNLGDLKKNDIVNLERALKFNGRFSGHFVMGHIDGVGRINLKQKRGNALVFRIEVPNPLMRYIVQKGSIAIDGVSLTVAEMTNSSFTVSIIPHTALLTTLGVKQVGSRVNIEVDLIGKYVEKLLKDEISSNLILKLKEHGFFKRGEQSGL